MFEKLRELKKMKELQDVLLKITKTVEENGVKVVINGKMEIEEIVLNPELEKENQERLLKNCINKAIREIQIAAAQSMSQMM